MAISRRALVAWLLLAAATAAAIGWGISGRTDADLAALGITRLHTTSQTGYHVSYLWRGSANGQRVIFIHDSPGSAAHWRHALAAAPGGFAAVAIDRPGFGETLPAVPAPRLEAQAAAIAPLLNAVGPAGAILVGRGWGSTIARATAREHGDRVRGIVLLPERRAGLAPAGAFIRRHLDWPPVRWLLPRRWRHAMQEQRGFNGDSNAAPIATGKIEAVYLSDDAAADPSNTAPLWAAIRLMANGRSPAHP